jgi:hypothetical protein
MATLAQEVINRAWPALVQFSWHSNRSYTLMSLSKHLPLISLPIARSKLRFGVILVHLHWVIASSSTSDQVELWDSCYSWWLLPPRWLWRRRRIVECRFGDCCRLRSSDCKGILCSSLWEIVKSNSNGIVASWSEPFEWLLQHPWWF